MRLARTEQATPFMALMAAWQVLLCRLSGQDDVVVGFPFSSRMGMHSESLVGLALNMLPLRTSCAGNPTFRALLRQVRKNVIDAYCNADIPSTG